MSELPANLHPAVLAKLCTSDSKSSSGTQSFMSRSQYHPGGSSSTLPSSAESDPNDNIFANHSTRPHVTQQHSSPGTLSMGGMRKQLPAVPYPTRTYANDDHAAASPGGSRARALTTSSYASTAIAPKLETSLDFGESSFDDMFSGLDRKESPSEFKREPPSAQPVQPGRSLLQGRRTFTSEPIKIDRHTEVELPLTSWDSRGSGDNLMGSPDEDDRSPPPVPVHKFSQYAPVASHSPDLASPVYDDEDAKLVGESDRSYRGQVPIRTVYEAPGSPGATQTIPLSPSSTIHATPKGVMRTTGTPPPIREEDDMFGSPNSRKTAVRAPASPARRKENAPTNGTTTRKVMTAAEFQAQQRYEAATQSAEDSSEDEYEDEDDIIRKQQDEQREIRRRQQQSIAREHMRKSTAAGHPSNSAIPPLSNGFPSETSLKADDWSDEDTPIGVLAQHGFPSKTRPPTQPSNAMPSYFRSDSPGLIDRPASAGLVPPSGAGNRTSVLPPFARNLPADPYAAMSQNGLVRQPPREPLGYGRPASVFNEPMTPGGYLPPDVAPSFTSLVDQIQMRDMSKQKYMGGASSKQPAGGPFTGALSGQMNAAGDKAGTRLSRMPQMGMPGMNPMMPVMGGQMPMMGMNSMPFPMYQQQDPLMMQQMYMAQMQQQMQMQAQQNAMFGQQPQFDPRMSMFGGMPDNRMSMMPQPNGFLNPQLQNNNFLGVGGPGQQRPMSIMNVNMNGSQPNLHSARPYSTLGPPGMAQPGGFPSPQLGPVHNGYSPSIAPSERSNIGLSARYRPVVTGNGMGADTLSTVGSSMTLQASGGASNGNGKTVKGILKKVPQVTVRDDDDDDDGWGKLAARKNKYQNQNGVKKDDGDALAELVKGVDGL